MQDLRVTLIQTALHWENIRANLAMFEEKIGKISEPTDLILLPEMFSTGFSMRAAELAESMDGTAVSWLRATARRRGTDVAGSLMIADDGAYFNRLVWARPDGTLLTYDKRHLFRMAGEEKVYSSGTKCLTVALRGWKIRPFICYDLRFPAWTRNVQNAYDLAVFVANWPEKRAVHWRRLLPARAIENLAYVIGVNRVGADGNGYPHSGDSTIIDPLGEALFTCRHMECTHTATLSYPALQRYRATFPAWQDADAFYVQDAP